MIIDELDQLAVHTETKDVTLSQLREMVDANDILTNPDYQRNYVYDDKRASLLVESILESVHTKESKIMANRIKPAKTISSLS